MYSNHHKNSKNGLMADIVFKHDEFDLNLVYLHIYENR